MNAIKYVWLLGVGLSFLIGCQTTRTSLIAPFEGAAPNALIGEKSPYLLQHAYNPVNWMPWGDKAIQKAMAEDKPLLISIGYSSCHWCNVMENESFSDSTVAKFMNENFVCIKVDREERPDIDQIYMEACQLLTGDGGWPLNTVALPDGRPFFASTYLSKKDWMAMLKRINTLYRKDKEKIGSIADQLTAGIKQMDLEGIQLSESGELEPTNLLHNAGGEAWKKNLDTENGGYIGTPKFPMPADLQSLMVNYHFTQDMEVLLYLKRTLNAIAEGGIYDQVGGGFARYATDNAWRVPHFEKMLYDNAQLVSAYAKGYQITKTARYRLVVYETLRFLEREMKDKSGGFYSSLSADSDDIEGGFYTWSITQIEELLKEDAHVFKDFFDIKKEGNWSGQDNILANHKGMKWLASELKLSEKEASVRYQSWLEILLKARKKRSKPQADTKMLTSWNALLLQAYVDAGLAFQDDKLLKKATSLASFIEQNLMTEGFRLNRQSKGGNSYGYGYLEDYALTIQGFLRLYEATLDTRWLQNAQGLIEYTEKHFYDSRSSYFFYASDKNFQLIARKIELSDHVLPASNAVMGMNFWKIGHIFGDQTYIQQSKQMLKGMEERMIEAPSLHTQWWELYFCQAFPFYEVAVVGADASEQVKDIGKYFLPQKVMLGDENGQSLSMLKGKYKKGQTIIYVCKEGTCKQPVNSLPKAIDQLELK